MDVKSYDAMRHNIQKLHTASSTYHHCFQLQCLCWQVYRFVFADSGTLLLCLTDPSGNLDKLRVKLRQVL